MTTPILPIDDDDAIDRAAAILRAGGLVAFPTETVYGLGADARNDQAAARIFEAKGRPRFNPLIVHAADLDAAAAIGRLGGPARRLGARFWPGPLTLVAPRADPSISLLVSAGLDTVALRVPAHFHARRLILAAGGALAAPSANPSGRLSPTTAEAVAEGLGDTVDLILDGGPCPVGIESTILAPAVGGFQLLREGGAPREEVEDALGAPLRAATRPTGAAPAAPGMLQSHYAPRARLRLNAEAPEGEEAYLAFAGPPAPGDRPSLSLSFSGDLREAAGNLFAHLRALDAALGPGGGRIAVARIPEIGLGRGVNDRLRRAAAPRPADPRSQDG